MRDVDFFTRLLSLKKPWRVSRVTLAAKEKEIEVWLEVRVHSSKRTARRVRAQNGGRRGEASRL